jgi:hypothetical protein
VALVLALTSVAAAAAPAQASLNAQYSASQSKFDALYDRQGYGSTTTYADQYSHAFIQGSVIKDQWE